MENKNNSIQICKIPLHLCKLALCTFMVIYLSSCSSQRALTKEERRVPPAMLETASNLVRAKLRYLGVRDDVDVIIDTNSSERRVERTYLSLWEKFLNIRQARILFCINFQVQIKNKPYFFDESGLWIDSVGRKYYKELSSDENSVWKQDSAFERPILMNIQGDYKALHEQRPITIDSAIQIAKILFKLSDSATVIRAFGQEGMMDSSNEFGVEHSTRRWVIWFALEPSKSMLLICWIDADTGNLCLANWSYNDDDFIIEGNAPNQFHSFTARVDSIKRVKSMKYLSKPRDK